MHYPPRLNHRFWRVWTAAGASSLGDGMVLVGFPLLALTYTRNAILIAGVATAGAIPAVLVALPAGTLADRVNRRRLLIGIELVRFAILAAFGIEVLRGAGNLPMLYVTVFLLRGLSVVFDITAGATLPTIVQPKLLVKANAHLITAQTVAQEIAGQALGGVLFAVTSALPFVADAATFAASAGMLNRAVPDNRPDVTNTSFATDLKEGLRWFARLRLLRILTGLIASLAFCQALVFGVIVLYATEVLHMTRVGFGLLLGISAIGTAVAALAANQIHARLGTGWTIVTAGLAASLAYPVLSWTHSPVAAGGALALETAGVVVGNVSARSLRQSVVPPELQGRVTSAYQMAVLTAIPLGSLAGGIMVGQIGVRETFLTAGLLQIALLVLTAPRLLASLRRQARVASSSPRVAAA
ncbi:MAG TPA: MFS transporter [Mycobacterium sp.]|nr:MFS transporter [Mycobacterium sp.]